MPTDIAMAILNAYKLKRQQNPAADQATLFKYILWDRFKNNMVTDAEMAQMATTAKSLSELSLMVLKKEKPTMSEGLLEKSARDAIRQYYVMNFPDGV
ncbi:hypothetical protein [Pseudodesulfovibrio sp. zrk46]|uniref:hypothetical protein n=1 Tax=Pseudodesulfovibrio sp. zrk46 TaxID=2725288 RepID=UPI00144A037C|nr:hypothetical protein [Pseudodesulfovibrio sp. zrk46]QJB55958.1 hypothetical protein HFN16_05830 [Pseudodesulfovibrio sp. zrk46]